MSEEQTGTATAEPENVPEMPGSDATAVDVVKRVEPTLMHRSVGELILTDDEIRRTWRTAAALATSGMWKAESGSAITPEMAFAKILVGRDLGLTPTRALMSIDLVRGAIQLRGVLLASFVRDSSKYHYKIVEQTAEKCRVLMLGFPQDEPEDGFMRSAGQWWEVLGEETYTIEDAQRQKLVKDGSAWQTVPKNMLFWRAISNGVKFHAPELLGGVPVYVEGEIPPAAPSLTEGIGDGSAPGVDLGPDVEAVLARAAKLDHVGLADRATAEMALMGQPPGVVARWVTEAKAELDRVEADGPIADADVVDDRHWFEVVNKVATCACGWTSPTCSSNAQATEAAEAHVEKATVAPEPVEDAVDAVNRAEVLRERAVELFADAEAVRPEDPETAAELEAQAQTLEAEADAIADEAQGALDLGA